MGHRGPPRTPTSVLKLRGSWRGNARGDEPEPAHDRPDCPEWLSAEERTAWDRVVALLESMRVLTEWRATWSCPAQCAPPPAGTHPRHGALPQISKRLLRITQVR